MYVNGVNKILNTTFQYNALQYNNTAHYDLNNKHQVELYLSDSVNKNRKIISFVKVEFMAELLCWITLDCRCT